MKKVFLIALMFLACTASAQQVEPVRYEVGRWNKEQGCHFQTLDKAEGIIYPRRIII